MSRSTRTPPRSNITFLISFISCCDFCFCAAGRLFLSGRSLLFCRPPAPVLLAGCFCPACRPLLSHGTACFHIRSLPAFFVVHTAGRCICYSASRLVRRCVSRSVSRFFDRGRPRAVLFLELHREPADRPQHPHRQSLAEGNPRPVPPVGHDAAAAPPQSPQSPPRAVVGVISTPSRLPMRCQRASARRGRSPRLPDRPP